MEWPFGESARPPSALLPTLPTLGEALQALRAEPMGAMPPAFFTALADPLDAVVAAVRTFVVGREMTFRVGGAEVTMTVTDLDVRSTPMALMVGQYENVRLIAERVSWGTTRLARLAIRCHNVHLRAQAPTTLVAAPIDIEATIDQAELARWLAARSRWLRSLQLTIGADAVVRVSVAARANWGHVEVWPEMDGSAVRLVPAAVVLGSGRRRRLRRLPGWRVRPARLPYGAFLNRVDTAAGSVSITLIVPEWRERISRRLLGKLADRLRARRRRVDVPRESDESDQPAAPTESA
jgi:hypothetical protein